MKSHPLRVLILLTLTALLIYSNTFSVPFLFDDIFNITGNPKVRSLVHFLDPSGTRYLGFLSFALNYHFGGLNPFGYHLVNLLIHIANGFLVYSLVLLLFRASQNNITPPPPPLKLRGGGGSYQWIALATALIFIAHPVQTQAVTYIVQRFASLVTLFYLLAVVCYLKWRIGETRGWMLEAGSRKLEAGKSSIQHPASSFCGICGSWLWYVAALIATVLAMKTKENSLTIPLTILLVEVIFFRAIRGAGKAPSSGPPEAESLPLNGPSGLVRWLTLFPFLLTLLIVPISYRGTPVGGEEALAPDIPGMTRFEYLFTQFRVIVTYLRLLVLPINQTLDYDYPVYHSFFHPAVLVSFVFLAGFVAFAIRQISRIGRIRLIGFGILWFFLTLSVESSIIPIKDVIFEHRVYLPSVGFFLAISLLTATAGERWKRLKVPLVLSLLSVVAGLAIAAHERNRVWQNAVTLWEDVTRKAPDKARGHVSLGVAYRAEGRLAEAIREFRTALRLNPEYPAGIHDNLGVVYTMQGAYPEAIREYQTALQLNSDDAEIHNNLGVALRDQGREEDAIAEYREALRLNPDHPEAHNNLGLIHKAKGRADEAMREFETAVRLNPDYAEAHGSLGIVYGERGRLQEAIAEFQTALRLQPDFAEAHANLGTVYQAMGRNEEARREFEEALKINPGFKAAREALDTFDSPP